jgi:hypothetical protein
LHTKFHTLVVEIPADTDHMAMMVPLMQKGVVKSLRSVDGDLIKWRQDYREKLTAAWNAVPRDLRKSDGDLRPMFDFVLSAAVDNPQTAEQLGLR